MIPRSCVAELSLLLGIFPCVGLIGPRQIGKTTLVRRLLPESKTWTGAPIYLDLENPRDRNKLGDPMAFFERNPNACFVLDEVQLMPDLFSVLRPVIDADRRPGRFILLGSASPQLIRGASESLAGRIAYVELTPFSRREVYGYPEADKHWIRGGYPESLLAANDEASELWRLNYLEAYITRELPMLGGANDTATMRRLLYMLAGQQGELANYSALARALGVSQATVKRYIDLLEQSFLVRALTPFHVNVRKRLVKAPKLYIRDAGLLHTLLGIDSETQLYNSVAAGNSWEGYVIEQIVNSLPSRVQPFFYRTHAGAEIDLVLIGRRGRIASVEVKLSSAPSLSKGYHLARTDIGAELSLVVAQVKDAYPMGEGIEVLPLDATIDVLTEWAKG